MTGSRWFFKHHASNSENLNLIEHDETEIKHNPIFIDEETKYLSVKFKAKVPLNVSWNPDYVVNISIRGVANPFSNILDDQGDKESSFTFIQINRQSESRISKSDQSANEFENEGQSTSGSDIDEDLFNMDVPLPLQPSFTTRSSYLNPAKSSASSDKMIKDFSEKLANSRERHLITSTIENSERYNTIRGNFDFFQSPSTSAPFLSDSLDHSLYTNPANLKENQTETNGTTSNNPDILMLPVLKELDRILANSRTLSTFKVKVHQVKEQIQDQTQIPTLVRNI